MWDAGPGWYSLGAIAISLPCAWAGGKLRDLQLRAPLAGRGAAMNPSRLGVIVRLAAIVLVAGCASSRHQTSSAHHTDPAATAPQTVKESAMSENANDHHASVNGLNIHYAIHGSGPDTATPLVLLHGGVGASEMFAPLIPALAAHRRVITIDLQGHGRTADIDRPLRYEAMADDVAALLRQLGIAHADVLGYSLGGGVATRLAIQHPAVPRKLILISIALRRDAWYPEVLATMAQMGPDAGKYMGQSPLAKLYPDVDWGRLFGKLGDLLRQDYDWTKEVAAIRAQTLLVYADADSLRPAQAAGFYGLLGGGQRDGGLDGSGQPASQLAILPGVTHYNVLTSPALAPIVTSFLDAPVPARR
jgi:pimeloyl-ACP methyl ester carboxylesterase